MSLQAVFVVVGLVLMAALLITERFRPGFTLFITAILFMAAGVIDSNELCEGFSNKAVLTILMLFLVSEGIRQSGALNSFTSRLFPSRKVTASRTLLRMLPLIATISAFLNNTAVVIIFAPIVKRWAERLNISPKKLLIPLSYATIMGGVCTLIGTSTNLVVHGMMLESGYAGFQMFELSKIGFIILIIGLIYLVVFGVRLLPDDKKREGGLKVSQNSLKKDDTQSLYEVVIASRCPAIGCSIEEFDFYGHYGATVAAIHHDGEVITEGIASHILQDGDTLLVLSDDHFATRWSSSSAFYFIAKEGDMPTPNKSRKRWFGLAFVVVLLLGATFGELILPSHIVDGHPMFYFVALVVVGMAIVGLFPTQRYTKYVGWDIIIAIASSFAICRALTNSGVANSIAECINGATAHFGDFAPYAALFMLYFITMVLTEMITNAAAVAIAFPIAVSISLMLNIDPTPLFVGICVAASSSFASPIGYQTNLIVQGIGGYRTKDFLRVGLPLNLIILIISVLLIPLIWSF